MADKKSLYEVDGISGATITSNGVTKLLKRDLQRYEPYFAIPKRSAKFKRGVGRMQASKDIKVKMVGR